MKSSMPVYLTSEEMDTLMEEVILIRKRCENRMILVVADGKFSEFRFPGQARAFLECCLIAPTRKVFKNANKQVTINLDD